MSAHEAAPRTVLFGALALVGLVDCGTPTPALPGITHADFGRVRNAFNAGTDGPRLIVFFSSGCEACDRGSAALEAMLEQVHEPVTVLAVWEPVSPSDPPPTAHMISNLRGRRVVQVWDPEHVVSDEMRSAETAHPGSISQARLRTDEQPGGILYDSAALFSPGDRWEATLPAPLYLDGGIAEVLPELRQKLATLAARRP